MTDLCGGGGVEGFVCLFVCLSGELMKMCRCECIELASPQRGRGSRLLYNSTLPSPSEKLKSHDLEASAAAVPNLDRETRVTLKTSWLANVMADAAFHNPILHNFTSFIVGVWPRLVSWLQRHCQALVRHRPTDLLPRGLLDCAAGYHPRDDSLPDFDSFNNIWPCNESTQVERSQDKTVDIKG